MVARSDSDTKQAFIIRIDEMYEMSFKGYNEFDKTDFVNIYWACILKHQTLLSTVS